jgi:hypothetical protein
VSKKSRKPHLKIAEPLKLDLGCGKNKAPGFRGVDVSPFDGVDEVADLRKKWPWRDNTVDEVHCSHFVEHLTSPERLHFWGELYRVLKVGATARIITPNWAHSRAYGDPTHQWPPVSEWTALYLNKGWRDANAPHVPLGCDFDFTTGGTWDNWLETRPMDTRVFAMQRYINSCSDIFFTLTKRAP